MNSYENLTKSINTDLEGLVVGESLVTAVLYCLSTFSLVSLYNNLMSFSAMYMDGQLIARKARGLLHQFRQMREIPCTLSGLCTRCGPGIWDSSHSPRVYCVGHDQQGFCNNCTN